MQNVFIGIGTNSASTYLMNRVTTYFRDGTNNYSWLTQFKLPSQGTHLKTMPMFGVEADTARSTNNMTVEFSDDDYQTWTTTATIDLSQTRKLAFRGGGFYDRAVRLSGTTSTEVGLHNFVARINA